MARRKNSPDSTSRAGSIPIRTTAATAAPLRLNDVIRDTIKTMPGKVVTAAGMLSETAKEFGIKKYASGDCKTAITRYVHRFLNAEMDPPGELEKKWLVYTLFEMKPPEGWERWTYVREEKKVPSPVFPFNLQKFIMNCSKSTTIFADYETVPDAHQDPRALAMCYIVLVFRQVKWEMFIGDPDPQHHCNTKSSARADLLGKRIYMRLALLAAEDFRSWWDSEHEEADAKTPVFTDAVVESYIKVRWKATNDEASLHNLLKDVESRAVPIIKDHKRSAIHDGQDFVIPRLILERLLDVEGLRIRIRSKEMEGRRFNPFTYFIASDAETAHVIVDQAVLHYENDFLEIPSMAVKLMAFFTALRDGRSDYFSLFHNRNITEHIGALSEFAEQEELKISIQREVTDNA